MHAYDDEMTPVQFAVVKYVADSLRDEPINVGLMAKHSDGRLVLRTVPTFGRVKAISGIDSSASLEKGLQFLRSALDRNQELDLDLLTERTKGIIQFSELLGGITPDEDEFIDEQFEFYCGENVRTRAARGTDRRQLRIYLRKALSTIGEDASRFEISKTQIRGGTGGHDMDFGFVNGRVSLLRAVSLQSQDSYILSEARAVSFAAADTKNLDYNITAVVALPETGSDTAEEALEMIQKNVTQTLIAGKDDVSAFLRDLMHDHEKIRPLSPDQFFEFASGKR